MDNNEVELTKLLDTMQLTESNKKKIHDMIARQRERDTLLDKAIEAGNKLTDAYSDSHSSGAKADGPACFSQY